MKVLFAINKEQISKAIIDKYTQLFSEKLEVKSVYYFDALIKEIRKNKSYDRIVIFEELEKFPSKNAEEINQNLFTIIDNVTDEIVNSEIIFVCGEERAKSDKLLKRFFSLGIYSVLVGRDRTIDAICRLIDTPRTKKEAKLYIDYGVEDNIYSKENMVDEVELQRIITHFKKLEGDTEKYVESFNRVNEQYSKMQMKVICSFLPEQVKRYLNQHSNLYKSYVSVAKDEEEVDIDVPIIDNKKIIATGKIEGNKTKENKKEIVKEIIKEVPVEKEVIKEVIKEVPVEKEVIKEVIKEVPVIKNEINEVVKQVFEVPKDYSKSVVFVGGAKVGTTFLINAISYILSRNGVKTAILDMTRERNMYYIYTKNSEKLRKKTEKSITDVILNNSVENGIDINKNLSVFTSVPGVDRKSYNHAKLLERLKMDYKVVLVDTDFTTPLDYFKLAKDLFIVQDMDILNVQQITSFLRELKTKDINLNKMQIILNKYVKTNVNGKKLIEGLAYYYDPQMTYVDELFDPKINYYTIPFNQENYIKYINNLYSCDMDFSGFTSDFLQMIAVICNVIYPANDNNPEKSIKMRKISFFKK